MFSACVRSQATIVKVRLTGAQHRPPLGGDHLEPTNALRADQRRLVEASVASRACYGEVNATCMKPTDTYR
jgi:hypothetical protein